MQSVRNLREGIGLCFCNYTQVIDKRNHAVAERSQTAEQNGSAFSTKNAAAGQSHGNPCQQVDEKSRQSGKILKNTQEV